MTLQIERAKPEDNKAICGLCEIPMAGMISLAMERRPDYFISAGIQNEHPEVYVCRDLRKDYIAGMFSVGIRTVFLKGIPTVMRYLSDLRIHPEYRKSLLLVRMSQFIKANRLIADDQLAWAVVFSDNDLMTNMIVRASDELLQRYSLLKFHRFGHYTSHMISLNRKPKKRSLPHGITIRRAQPGDIPAMQTFFDREAARKEGFPCYRFDRLDQEYYHGLQLTDFYLAFYYEEIVGITGMWDQSTFKQTRVTGYTPFLSRLRPVINVFSKLSGGFILPGAGEKLRYFVLHTIVLQNDDMQVFGALLDQIYLDHSQGPYSYFLCGLAENDPLQSALSRFRSKRTISGDLYQVSLGLELQQLTLSNAPFYLEAARI